MKNAPDKLPEKLIWCEHIHNWGNSFYFVDTHNPFAVSGKDVWGQGEWNICPICKELNPLLTSSAGAKAPQIPGTNYAEHN